jgi:hypothetical protein
MCPDSAALRQWPGSFTWFEPGRAEHLRRSATHRRRARTDCGGLVTVADRRRSPWLVATPRRKHSPPCPVSGPAPGSPCLDACRSSLGRLLMPCRDRPLGHARPAGSPTLDVGKCRLYSFGAFLPSKQSAPYGALHQAPALPRASAPHEGGAFPPGVTFTVRAGPRRTPHQRRGLARFFGRRGRAWLAAGHSGSFDTPDATTLRRRPRAASPNVPTTGRPSTAAAPDRQPL